jgi:hypothetical protein
MWFGHTAFGAMRCALRQACSESVEGLRTGILTPYNVTSRRLRYRSYAQCAPAGVPKPVMARLNADVVKALGTPDVRQRFADIGLDAEPQTPEQFAVLIKSETAKWAKGIKDARIPLQ